VKLARRSSSRCRPTDGCASCSPQRSKRSSPGMTWRACSPRSDSVLDRRHQGSNG
jgi:hypothetical protein